MVNMIISYYCYDSGLSTPKVDELWRKAKSGLPPAFISKVLFGHIHVHSFTECQRLFLWNSGRVVLTVSLAHKASNISYQTLYRNSFLTPALGRNLWEKAYTQPLFLFFFSIANLGAPGNYLYVCK